MLHALLFAAATCTMGATVTDADARLTKADAVLAQHKPAGAQAEYDAAMHELQAAPFFPEDKTCDAGYPLARFTVTLHSLRVAEGAGFMAPFEAYQHLRQMQRTLFQALSSNAGPSFAKNYPDLSKQEWRYIEDIESAAQAQRIAAHDPQGTNCQWPDVDADVLDQAQPAYPEIARNAVEGPVQAVIDVKLGADGHILSETVTHSSGNIALDQSALAAARQSTYLPAVKNCARVRGSFNFTVTFDPNR